MTNPDFDLQQLLAWARTKPADEGYDYADYRNCAICQFLRETGRCDDPAVSENHWRDRTAYPIAYRYFEDRLRIAANHDEQTFGALVTRLEALIPNTWTKVDAYLGDLGDAVPARAAPPSGLSRSASSCQHRIAIAGARQ